MATKKREADKIDSFTNGTSLINDERMRQCEKGYGREHDDLHVDGSLLRAAMDTMVVVAAETSETGEVPDPPEWVQELVDHIGDKYRRAPIRRLVIAGAMLVAEIERRQRLELKSQRKRR